MQITHIEVIPITLDLRVPIRTAYSPAQGRNKIQAVILRIETRQGINVWGCAAFDPHITGETLADVTKKCRNCADRALDLNPLNMEYALSQLTPIAQGSPAVLSAFDMAFHDLLALAAGIPLYRLLGGFRDRIQTSITIGVSNVQETVAMARDRAKQGFRILKIKGGCDAQEDVNRIRAVADALPRLILRLDADGGYSVEQALHVARALKGKLEMLEQPTSAESGMDQLRLVTEQSPIPVLADQSAVGPASALQLATGHCVDGLSIKLAPCGGLRCARQMDAIARAARMTTMVGCIHSPALMIAAELAFALSSPAVRYGDLDGHFDLLDDPTHAGFVFDDGWLIATDVPGLGCSMEL
jgi:L-alanine-DL-glutamate epimerase-like enolase superfamily enzyme